MWWHPMIYDTMLKHNVKTRKSRNIGCLPFCNFLILSNSKYRFRLIFPYFTYNMLLSKIIHNIWHKYFQVARWFITQHANGKMLTDLPLKRINIGKFLYGHLSLKAQERLKMLDTLTQIANSAHNVRVQCTLYYDHRASISKTVTMNWWTQNNTWSLTSILIIVYYIDLTSVTSWVVNFKILIHEKIR